MLVSELPGEQAAVPSAILDFLRLLRADGEVFEIRAPRCPDRVGSLYTSTVSGYFDMAHLDDAVAGVTLIDRDQQPAGVYVTLNPVNPALLARAANRIRAKAQATTGDGDIQRRRFLLVDIDPKRPADISATEAEMRAAIELARRMKQELCAEGWPVPLGCMSGNGAYLIFAVDLPNDEASKALVQGGLDGLAARFNTPEVAVDRTTFNAARIVKVMGTHARKGDSVPERPHRLAKILKAEDGPLQPVPVALLQAIAPVKEPRIANKSGSSTPLPPQTRGATAREFDRFDPTPAGVRGYLERHGVRVAREQEDGAYTQLVLEQCPITGSEGGTSVAVRVHASGQITYHNLHASAVGSADSWHALRDHLEPGYLAFARAHRMATAPPAARSVPAPVSPIGPATNLDDDEPAPAEVAPPEVHTLGADITAVQAFLRTQHGRSHIGIATGRFQALDTLLSGFHGLNIIAAEPGIGKTALGLNLGLAAVETHHFEPAPVVFVFFSFEMSRQAMTLRLMSHMTGLKFRRLLLGDATCSKADDGLQFSRTDRDLYDIGVERLQGYQDRIVILDRQDVGPVGLSRPAEWLNARILAAKAAAGVTRAFVLVDSLQTIPSYTDPLGQPWRSPLDEERYKVAELLKVTEACYPDPVLVISEQSKSAMGKTDLTAVLGSGRAVYGPDVVIFLKRSDDGDPSATRSDSVEIDLVISKARDGATRGTVPLTFNFLTSIFEENDGRRPVVVPPVRSSYKAHVR